METLSVTLQKQPWICVLDPILMLCSQGLQGVGLTQQLGHLLELWVVRELWHILDDTPCYLDRTVLSHRSDGSPDLFDTAFSSVAKSDEKKTFSSGDEASLPDLPLPDRSLPDLPDLPLIDARSLYAWSHIRNATDLEGYQFYWMGDAVRQSRLPAWIKQGKTPDARLQRYELLAQSLEASSPESPKSIDVHQPLKAACRDAASLAAALGSSFILAAQRSPNEPPYIVQCLQSWGICCQQKQLDDAVVEVEKNLFYQLFVQAGLAKLLWSKTLHLAVVHLNVPAGFDPGLTLNDPLLESLFEDEPDRAISFSARAFSHLADDSERLWELENIPSAAANLWDGTQVFWYSLSRHAVMATNYADTRSIVQETSR